MAVKPDKKTSLFREYIKMEVLKMSRGIQYSYDGTKRIEFLLILRLIAEGKSIRQTAEISNVSAPSILRIKHEYKQDIDKLKINRNYD